MNPLKINLCLMFAALMVAAISCSSASETRAPESITIEQATTLLDRAYEASTEHDIESLCKLGGSILSCENAWLNTGEWPAAPDARPAVVSSRILPDQQQDNGNVSRGGRLLEVEGVDGLGRAFSTDFLVFDEGGGKLVALNPVYWTGVSVGHPSKDGSAVAFPSSPDGS